MPIIIIVGTIIIALAIGSIAYFSNRSTTESISDTPEVVRIEESEEATIPEPISDVLDEDTTTSLIVDTIETSNESGMSGTFNANSSYLTPRRTEHTVALSLTLENNIVTAVSVAFDGQPTGQYSNDNQARFDATYQSEVVGKRIENISLARVGGASLTSRAFNEAVAQIRARAS